MNLTLTIMAGRRVFRAPYHPENMAATARELHEHMPTLRQMGRVAVYVREGRILHLITTERQANA